jgi:hypothetical protein
VLDRQHARLDAMLGRQVEPGTPEQCCKAATKCSQAFYGDRMVDPAQ